ncbi:MAG: EamA family transporter [Nanoarchaeota archaeon]|nr:EamA family transporter [Nanoarchaeota archaeon]
MIALFIIFLILVGVLSGSMAVILLKKAASKYPLRQLFFRRIFWEGVVLFGLSLLLYVIILQREELSVVYPLSSISYLITTLLSVKYLGEKMSVWKWVALGGVMLGVTLIAIGS